MLCSNIIFKDSLGWNWGCLVLRTRESRYMRCRVIQMLPKKIFDTLPIPTLPSLSNILSCYTCWLSERCRHQGYFSFHSFSMETFFMRAYRPLRQLLYCKRSFQSNLHHHWTLRKTPPDTADFKTLAVTSRLVGMQCKAFDKWTEPNLTCMPKGWQLMHLSCGWHGKKLNCLSNTMATIAFTARPWNTKMFHNTHQHTLTLTVQQIRYCPS